MLWDMFSGSCIREPWARAPLRLAPEAPERAATLVLPSPVNPVVLLAIEQNALIHSTIFATVGFVSRIG